MLKKFFKNSGPQFKHLKDVWLEYFCTRLRVKTLRYNDILKSRHNEADTIYFIITGQISVYDPRFDSDEYVLVNRYHPGMSVCDPVQNQTASYFSRVIVTSKEPTRVFYMSKETYINIYVEEINK